MNFLENVIVRKFKYDASKIIGFFSPEANNEGIKKSLNVKQRIGKVL